MNKVYNKCNEKSITERYRTVIQGIERESARICIRLRLCGKLRPEGAGVVPVHRAITNDLHIYLPEIVEQTI